MCFSVSPNASISSTSVPITYDYSKLFQAETLLSVQRDKCIKKAKELLDAGRSVAVGTCNVHCAGHVPQLRSRLISSLSPSLLIFGDTFQRRTEPDSCLPLLVTQVWPPTRPPSMSNVARHPPRSSPLLRLSLPSLSPTRSHASCLVFDGHCQANCTPPFCVLIFV